MTTLNPRARDVKQSEIRRASVRCAELGGINLGQGVCDIPTPQLIKERAYQAIEGNKNTYSACGGVKPLREAIAKKLKNFNKLDYDPMRQVMVSHGASGAFVCAVQTLLNPTDEVILFEPFYGYHKRILDLYGVTTRAITMGADDFSIDWTALENAITPKTRMIVICTPCNPTGKVFSKEELLKIGRLAKQHDLLIITDEIYEYITYPGFEHISLASLEDFSTRTITISGFSKTYNMTGWRLGYASGPADIISQMALVQDLLYVCPSTPLQHGVLAAFDMPESYFQTMRDEYLIKRDHTCKALRDMGFQFATPEGAYYIMANIEAMPFTNDEDAANKLLEDAKVAVVPGRAFYHEPESGKQTVRFCFALDDAVITKALAQVETMLASNT